MTEPEPANLPPYGEALRHQCMDVVTDISQGVSHPLESGTVAKQLIMPLFPGVTLTAHLRYWEHNVDGSFTWVGEVDNDTSGTAIVTVVEGKTSANIWDGNDLYVIQPDPSCGHVVVQVDVDAPGFDDKNIASADTGVVATDTATVPDVPLGYPSLGTSTNQVEFLDHLMLYTPDASCNRGGSPIAGSTACSSEGIAGFLHNAVHDFRLVLRRSGIYNYTPRLVGVVAAPSSLTFVEDDFGHNLAELRSDFVAGGDAWQLRVEYGADVVGFAQGQKDGAYNGYAHPVANQNMPNGPLNLGVGNEPKFGRFGIVASNYVVTNYVLAHEVGHLLKILHDCNGCLRTGYRELVDHEDNPTTHKFRTLMKANGSISSLADENCRIGAFSVDHAALGFGWRPGDLDAPMYCDQRHSVEFFGPSKYFDSLDPMTNGDPSVPSNGVRLGQLTSANGWPKADAAGYIQAPQTLAPGGPLASMVQWMPVGAASRQPLTVAFTNQPPHAVTAGTNLRITWEESPYAAELLAQLGGPTDTGAPDTAVPPPPCPPQGASCDEEWFPYYLELGTAVGLDDLGSQWVGYTQRVWTSGTVPAPSGLGEFPDHYTGDTTPRWMYSTSVPITTTGPIFGRLWTQLHANQWSYTEFRILQYQWVSCSDEDPSVVSEFNCGVAGCGYASMSCPLTGPAALVSDGNGATQVQFSADVSSFSPVNVSIENPALTSPSPYDVQLVFTDGVSSHCCLADYEDHANGLLEVTTGTHGDQVVGLADHVEAGHERHLVVRTGDGEDLVVTPNVTGSGTYRVDVGTSFDADGVVVWPGTIGDIATGPGKDEVHLWGGSNGRVVETKRSSDVVVVMPMEGTAASAFGAGSVLGGRSDDVMCVFEGQTAVEYHDGTSASPSTADQVYLAGPGLSSLGTSDAPTFDVRTSAANCWTDDPDPGTSWAGPDCTMSPANGYSAFDPPDECSMLHLFVSLGLGAP